MNILMSVAWRTCSWTKTMGYLDLLLLLPNGKLIDTIVKGLSWSGSRPIACCLYFHIASHQLSVSRGLFNWRGITLKWMSKQPKLPNKIWRSAPPSRRPIACCLYFSELIKSRVSHVFSGCSTFVPTERVRFVVKISDTKEDSTGPIRNSPSVYDGATIL